MTEEVKEEKVLNLWQKIVEVRKVAGGFSKDSHSYGYSYVSGNQVLGKIKDKMNELNLILMPSTKIGEHVMHEYKTAKGKDVIDFVVFGTMSYTWINGDNPTEREVVEWAYYGQQDDISKAYGSALTYSERYYLLKCLGLPTDEDDPDAKEEKTFQGKQNNQPKQQQQNNQPVDENGPIDDVKSKVIFAKIKAAKLTGWEEINKFLGYEIKRTNEVKLKDFKKLADWLDTKKVGTN